MGLIFTIAGTAHKFEFKGLSETLHPQKKKDLRLKISKNLEKNYIPLHACLLVGEINILISGKSGSGKSTLANQLKEDGYSIEAADFVVAWLDNGELFASDLNYASRNEGKKPKRINKIIFLDINSKKDVSRHTKNNLKEFYTKLFDTNNNDFKKFAKSDTFAQMYKKHMVLGNRISPKRWKRAVNLILASREISNIGIIGVGTIGEETASLLMTQGWIKQLNLYSRSKKKLKGVAKDLESANPKIKIELSKSIKDLISESQIVILCFKSNKKENAEQERFQRLNSHLKIIWDLSRKIRDVKPEAYFLVVTNPMDIISWSLYQFSNLNNNMKPDWKGLLSGQVLGVGLGLDHKRMKTFTDKRYQIIGEHGENLIITQLINNNLDIVDNNILLENVICYSPDIRKCTKRTKHGPSHELFNIVKTLKKNKGVLRVSVLNEEEVFLGSVINWRKGVPEEKYNLDVSTKNYLKKLNNNYKKLQNTILKSKLY